MAMFMAGDNVERWMGSIWTQLLLHQGGASLQQWIHKVNFLDNGLQPPPSVVHTAVHKFTPRDADTATLEAMLERGELIGTSAESFFPNQPRTLGISDEVEVLMEMPTEGNDETRDEWIDRQATIVKVEEGHYLVHFNVGPAEESTRWFPSTRVRRAPQAVGVRQSQHAGTRTTEAAARSAEIYCRVRAPLKPKL